MIATPLQQVLLHVPTRQAIANTLLISTVATAVGSVVVLWTAAARGDLETARRLAEKHWSSEEANDHSSLIAAAMVGDLERANGFAARIDARPGGQLVLNNARLAARIATAFCAH